MLILPLVVSKPLLLSTPLNSCSSRFRLVLLELLVFELLFELPLLFYVVVTEIAKWFFYRNIHPMASRT